MAHSPAQLLNSKDSDSTLLALSDALLIPYAKGLCGQRQVANAVRVYTQKSGHKGIQIKRLIGG